jgi:outer membrane receptor for ferrienterochelin and colicin
MEFGDSKTRALWGNTIGAARWTTILNPKFFLNTTATYSYFRYALTDRNSAAAPDSLGRLPDYNGLSAITDASLRLQADYFLSSSQRIQFGVHYVNARFAPASTTFGEEFQGFNNTVSAAAFNSQEVMLYAEDELKLSPQWSVRAGLHWANWFSSSYYYQSLQPRLYITWRPDERNRLFLAATRMSQFLHLLTSNTSSLPADFWVPSTSTLKPGHSWLYSLGYASSVRPWASLSAEVYYKDMRNVVGYRGASNIFQNSARWEESLVQGKGESYGLELAADVKLSPVTATLCYTLSRTTRQFETLNDGAPFPYRYDRRHNLKLEAVYQKGKRFRAVVGWTYMSGEAVTLPDQVYPGFENNILGSTSSNPFVYGYGKPNNYRLPAIHRLDIALQFMRNRGHHFQRTWTLGVYNAYGRRNIVGVALFEEAPGQYQLQGYSLFRFIPTISYAIKF